MNLIPSLELQQAGPLWAEVLLLIGTLLVWGYSLYSTKHQPLNIRIMVGVLRTILLGFGYLLLHHPTLLRQRVKPQEQRLAVIVDRSGSMGAEAAEGESRYQRAYSMMNQLQDQGIPFDVFEMDQTLSEPLGQQLRPRKLSGAKTDYYSGLNQFFTGYSNYSSALLLSDGHDLGRFSQMSVDETKNWLTRLQAPPLNTVLIGDQLDGPEVAIHSIDAPSFSFVRAPLRIRATIIVRNLDQYSAQVQLLEGEQPIQVKDLILDDQGFGTVEFEFYPEEQGEHLYTISVPAHHLERNVENNRQRILVEIGRDKINVLHIAGSITWDLQGLRAMFERNPAVDLTAFYIMRTRAHIQQGVDNRRILPDEMALVPFPTEEIFDRQLFGFDVVVFQDFDAGTYFSDSYQARRLMRKIKEFVSNHRGGFVVVGGPRTANGPSLSTTPLVDILPLAPPVYLNPYDEKVRSASLRKAPQNHPILRQYNAKDMPFRGSMQGMKAHKNAQILLEDNTGRPLLATMESGNGRVLSLNTSSSWKWRQEALAKGKPGDAYYDFWEQVLKWAIQDPAMRQVRLVTTKTAAQPLDLNVEVLLRNRQFQPVKNTKTEVALKSLDGNTEPIIQEISTNQEGIGQTQFKAERPGYYQVTITEDKWKGLSRPKTVFLGGSQDELRNADLVPETLERLAAFSGGQFQLSTDGFNPQALNWKDQENIQILETHRLKLRNWIWSLPILLLLAALEWTVRRSRHLA